MGSHQSQPAPHPQKDVCLEKWKEECVSQQGHFYNQLGDRIWDKFIYPQDRKYLYHKIAIPLFGQHMEDNIESEFTDAQKKTIDEILEKCLTHSVDKNEIHIAVLFVNIYLVETKQTTLVPLFRVMSHKNEDFDNIPNNIFIDHVGRVYEDWQKYLNGNIWDMSWMCVPKNGYYSSGINFDIHDQSSRGKVVETLDKISSITGIVTGLTMMIGIILSFFPPTAPIGATIVLESTVVGAPGAIYGVGRSIEQLVDRKEHEQSIGLANSDARQCWLLSVSSLLAVTPIAASKVISTAAAAGKAASAVTRAAVTALNVTTSSVAGLGIINSIYELSKKESVTALDILQLTTSIFFFSHSLVTLKTANGMIKNAQEKQIATMREALTPEQQIIHDALLNGSKDVVDIDVVKEMHGRAKFIRVLKRIDDIDEFYSHFEIKTDGQLYINSELTIHPRAFLQMSESNRQTILNLSKSLNKKEITMAQFNKDMGPIQKEYRLRLDRQRVDAEIYLKKTFGVNDLADIKIGDTKLGALKPTDVDRLEQVVKNSYHNGDAELIKIAKKFAQKQGASNFTEYCATGEYVIRQVEAEIAKRRAVNPNPSRPSGVKAKDFYKSQVVAELLQDDAKMNAINDTFNKLRAEVDAVNTGHPKFDNSIAAANHYDKHPFFPKVDPLNNLSCEMYFDIATEMAGGPITDIQWTQDGSALKCTFISEKYGATVIRYDNLANRTSVIATLLATDVSDSRLYNANSNN